MSLRRTALTRRTELRRTPMPRPKTATRNRAAKTIARQRSTGPTAAQRDDVAHRAGHRCELCGHVLFVDGLGWITPHSFHHRRPRAMGGTSRPEANSPANLLLLCGSGTTGCHGGLEGNREVAYAAGLLVRQAADPASIPAALYAGLVLLTHDGNYQEA